MFVKAGPERKIHVTRGGKTHVVHLRGSRLSGSLAGLRLCIVMHVGSSGGSRGWQGLLGRPSDWGDRPTPTNGRPQRIPLRNDKTMFVRFGKAFARARWRFP